MTTERLSFSLRLEQAEHLPLRFFHHTSGDLRQLLMAIERARSGEAAAQWTLEADEIQITASVNGISGEALQDILTDTYEAFRANESADLDLWPTTLDNNARQLVRKIATRVKRIAPARVQVLGHAPLYLEPERFAAQIPRRRREEYSGWASVDGELDVISVRHQPYFVIYEHGTGHRIRCTFPDDWIPAVKELLGFRVVAEGFIHYQQDGRPTSLTNPTLLERVPEPEKDIRALRGATPGISGELSSHDYIRQLRESV